MVCLEDVNPGGRHFSLDQLLCCGMLLVVVSSFWFVTCMEEEGGDEREIIKGRENKRGRQWKG